MDYPVSFIIRINCLENPQRGVLRSPFMKTITLALLIKALRRSSRLPPAATLESPANFLHFDVNSGMLIPSILSIALLSLKKITVGTASIWDFKIVFIRCVLKIIIPFSPDTWMKFPAILRLEH